MKIHEIRVMIIDKDAIILEILDLKIKSETINTAAVRVREIIEHRFETSEN